MICSRFQFSIYFLIFLCFIYISNSDNKITPAFNSHIHQHHEHHKHGNKSLHDGTDHNGRKNKSEIPPTGNPTYWNPLVSLFDLSVDPYEQNDISNYPNYTAIVNDMTTRALAWTKKLAPGDINNTGLLPAWWACNAICPWQIDVTPALKVPKKYTPKQPPNIVFVLVDDWGWNDLGLRSTYLNWTTPTLDRLARSGVQLDSYFTHWVCTPSRSAFLTGRYATRLGTWLNEPVRAAQSTVEIPLSEVTIAQELRSAGYRNYMVGKWHVGFSSLNRMPLQRGFDYFYGFLNGYIDYYTKVYRHWTDLTDGNQPVRNMTELDTFAPHLFSRKMSEVIATHAELHKSQPMFLFASTPLVHSPYQAPAEYIQRCIETMEGFNDTRKPQTLHQKLSTYCAMNILLDETVANLTCALKKHGLDKNLLFVLASDNGGVFAIPGTNVPFRGHKGTSWRGGVGATAFVTGDYLPSAARGKTYSGLMHVTDWLPTLMGIATEGKWAGGLTNAELDGVDMWEAITHFKPSPRKEILHFTNGATDGPGLTSYQLGSFKIRLGANENMKQAGWRQPEIKFPLDHKPDSANAVCKESLV